MNEDILTPEEYEILLALGNENAALDPMIAQQMEQVQMLRDRSVAPDGQMVGRVHVAPHALEYMAALGNQYKAKGAEKQLKEFQEQQLGNRNRQNEMVMRGIVGKPTGQPMPAAQDPYARFRMDGGSA